MHNRTNAVSVYLYISGPDLHVARNIHRDNMPVYTPLLYSNGTPIFLIFAPKHRFHNMGTSKNHLGKIRRDYSNEKPQSMFWSKNKKNIKTFLLKIFSYLQLKQNLNGPQILTPCRSYHGKQTSIIAEEPQTC